MTNAVIAQGDAPPPQASEPEKKQRISKRITAVVRGLIDGKFKTRKEAADAVGMNYTHLCEALHKPHIRVFYERCVRESIGAGQMIAAARLNELVHASSEHVSADVAKHILAIGGVKPASAPQVAVSIGDKAGYVIILAGRAGTYPSDMSRPNVNEIKDITPNGE